jgi:hypothetical protein
MQRGLQVRVAVAALVLGACGGGVEPSDGGGMDAQVARDGGTAQHDANAGEDAGGAPDAGSADAGAVLDGASGDDASVSDAAVSDAAVSDAGSDAGLVTCADNDECLATELCAAATCGGLGVCTPLPIGCPDVVDPVCGCDGVTYGNACEASAARQNVASRGACELDGGVLADAGSDAGTVRGCTDNADCARLDSYCAKRLGDCAGTGMCERTPDICPFVIRPVCGCDGITYDNGCLANSAGVNVLHDGACAAACDERPTAGCCFEDGDCGSRSQRCVGEDCRAGGEGTCVSSILLPDRCWEDSDCDLGEVCTGARRCPCGALCIVPDAPGTCSSIIVPAR